MFKNRLAIWVLLAAFSSLFACQAEQARKTKAEKLFISYYARYMQNDRIFRAEADFLKGDSLHNAQVIEMAAVSFQGGSMEIKSTPGRPSRYKTVRRGAFQSQLKFKCQELEDGQSQVTDFQVHPIESFIIKDNISKEKGFTIVWKGLPLKTGEELLLLFADKNNIAASTTIQGPSDRSELTIEGDFMKDLQTGSAILLLVRSQKGKKVEEENVISYELAHYSTPQEIEILP